MYYYYYDEFGEEKKDIASDIIKRLAVFYQTSNTKLCDSTEAQELYNEMLRFSTNMLSYQKSKNKRFTVFADNKIRRMQIDDETGEFNEKDTLILYNLFRNEEYFHELIARCFVNKKIGSEPLEHHIFYISCSSKFSKETIDIFMLYQSNDLFVKFNNTTMNIVDFAKDYLGAIDDGFKQEIKALCNGQINKHIIFQKRLTEIFNNYSESKSSTPDLLEGAICFFDFLGWKGLWQYSSTEPLEKVTELIKNIKNELTSQTEKAFPDIPISKHMSTLISISDTIAIFTPKINGIDEVSLLALHAKIARYILEESCKIGYPIRGAISYGEYSLMNNIMIGPGIDECASWHETCNWIGAHFTPSAQFILDGSWDDKKLLPIKQNITKFSNIPTKSGVPKIEFCIKWNISTVEFNKLRSKVKAILPEIAAKYLNTYEFLKICRKEDKSNG